MKKILIVAGDKSGDLYGGLLCRKIKERHLDVQIYSFGGKGLAEHSTQLINLLSHSVSGIVEVISHLGQILKIFKLALVKIEKIKPDLIILIDFPDFNLRLAKTLNSKYPLFYYVSPQVWAWRKERITLIKQYVDIMIVIFKFEEEFYRKEGMEVKYFGHPLLEIIPKQEINQKRIISLMPGSRKNEIKRHLPIMIEAKKIIEEKLKDYQFRIIRPENIENGFYAPISQNIEVIDHTYQAIQESEFIITSSGTATVEIAILGVPFLIIYKVNTLTWKILRRMVKAKFIGMVNILAGEKIIEELLQGQVSPQAIAAKTLELLADKAKYAHLKERLGKIREVLSPLGASEKFASFIIDYLQPHR
ncbi:MAG: lipid-A-disaccharide synthase [Candidatus Omnitrophica bacterium]|nr:lipid-A-disaccharide synthase [Candidatus Omnitrophota bacterium]